MAISWSLVIFLEFFCKFHGSKKVKPQNMTQLYPIGIRICDINWCVIKGLHCAKNIF